MKGKKSQKRDLDDIQVLGVWNFTIQPETPLVWLRTGPLDRYLLRFQLHSDLPSTAGLIFHSEADGPGIDGASFWIERRELNGELTRRYILAGEGLESKPIATRKYPDPGGEAVEDIEVLVQGFTAVIFVRDRQVQIRCRTKASRGSICFYNSTKAEEGGTSNEDVHFSNCRITALRRGPLEVGGILGRRERALNKPPEEAPDANLDPLQADGSVVFGDGEKEQGDGFHDSVATTAATGFGDSPGVSTHLSKSGAATTMGFNKSASSPGLTRGGFRHTTTARGGFGKQGSPDLTRQNAMFASHTGGGPPRMRATFSDSSLRKSGVALCGLSPASKARGFGGDEWVPLITNPPKSEMKFMQEHAIRPSKSDRACKDFIKM